MKNSKNSFKAKYDQSRVMKRAWKLFKAQDVKTMEQWSICLTQSHNIEKNGIKDVNIDTIYKKYYQQVYFFILIRVGNKSEIAEELTNDVFLKARKHLENYDVQVAKLNTWLLHIAKNIVIDNHRVYGKDNHINMSEFNDVETGREVFQVADNSTNVDSVENVEVGEAISKAMQNLKPKYQQIAKLRFIDEKNYKEICEILNIPLGNVKVMISRASKMLREELKDVRQNA